MEYFAISVMVRASIESLLESSDSEEEIFNHDNERELTIARVKNYIEVTVPLMCDETFKSHFRMRRDMLVKYLINLLGADLQPPEEAIGRRPIPVQKQILIALWTMATPDSYRSVCDRFDVSKSTAWSTLYTLQTFIKWPTNAEAQATSEYIFNRFGFPGVIGAVDGTHIKIAAPKNNPHNYINRKGQYSIQTQVVCDHNLKFIHGEVGSVHDSRVFRLSGLQDFCTPVFFPGDTHLLGDKAYTLQQHLMVPYRNNHHLDNATIRYNTVHSSSRMMIERSIGMLKGRFRSLLDKLPIKRTELIPFYIVACCILHNICIIQDGLIDIPIIANGNIRFQLPPPLQLINVIRVNGFNKREQIKNAL